MPVTVEHDIADHQDRGLIESRHGQLHGATHIQNEQGRDISTGFAMACDWHDAESTTDQIWKGLAKLTCGEGACSGHGLPANAYLPDAPSSKCGSWLACNGHRYPHSFVITEGNHDAKRPLLILGAPLNHAGGLRAHRAQARCQVVGQERFAYFGLGRHPGFCKVSRPQGGTLGGRYRRNG